MFPEGILVYSVSSNDSCMNKTGLAFSSPEWRATLQKFVVYFVFISVNIGAVSFIGCIVLVFFSARPGNHHQTNSIEDVKKKKLVCRWRTIFWFFVGAFNVMAYFTFYSPT